MKLYRLTRHKANPDYWQTRDRVSYHTEKSLIGVLNDQRQLPEIVRLESAEVGEFSEITKIELAKYGDGETEFDG